MKGHVILLGQKTKQNIMRFSRGGRKQYILNIEFETIVYKFSPDLFNKLSKSYLVTWFETKTAQLLKVELILKNVPPRG